MKKLFIIILLITSTISYSQTKEECIKYIKTRYQARYKENPISVKLVDTKLIIKTPSLGNSTHETKADLLFLDDVMLGYDDYANVYQVNLYFSKKCCTEDVYNLEGKKTTASNSTSTCTVLGFEKAEKEEAEKLLKIIKRLAKLCGAKVLDIK